MPGKSKRLIGIIAAVMSAVVFATTAMAASNNVSGYERVRESMFTYYEALNNGNYTLNLSAALENDGEEVASLSMMTKQQNPRNNSSSSTYNIAGNTHTEEHSYNNGISIRKDSLTGAYYKNGTYYDDYDYESYGNRDLTDNERRLIRILFDMFAGDAKNYCAYDNGKITLRLEKGQIPEVFQALISVVSENALSERVFGISGASSSEDEIVLRGIENILKDTSFDSVDAEGIIDENGMLNDAKMVIAISGYDQSGAPHKMNIVVSYNITDIGSTVSEPIDLTGKNFVDSSRVYNKEFEDLYAKYINGELTWDDIPEEAREYLEDYFIYDEDIRTENAAIYDGEEITIPADDYNEDYFGENLYPDNEPYVDTYDDNGDAEPFELPMDDLAEDGNVEDL